MRIEEFANQLGIEVVRSREFHNLGFFTDRREDVLSPFFDDKFRAELIGNPRITMVLASPALAHAVPEDRGVAIAEKPLDALINLHIQLVARGFYWKSFKTRIAPDAQVHRAAYVADQDVEIGHRVRVEPNATIFERSIIGDDSVIRAGAVIGEEGFEPRDLNGQRIIVPHAGGVKLGQRVEIMANTVIDRAVYGGFTEIGNDTKIDNLVHIAHNVSIGERCRIVALALIGGSTAVGDDVWIGPGATVGSSRRIGDRARITMGAVVTQDVAPGGHVSGNFAIEHAKLIAFLRTIR